MIDPLFKRLELQFEYKWHCDYPPHPKLSRRKIGARGIKFDPTLSDPDALKVKINAETIEAILYGSLIPAVLNFKENIFGYWDYYTAFSKASESDEVINLQDQVISNSNPEKWTAQFRPFSVIVEVNVKERFHSKIRPKNIYLYFLKLKALKGRYGTSSVPS